MIQIYSELNYIKIQKDKVQIGLARNLVPIRKTWRNSKKSRNRTTKNDETFPLVSQSNIQ